MNIHGIFFLDFDATIFFTDRMDFRGFFWISVEWGYSGNRDKELVGVKGTRTITPKN